MRENKKIKQKEHLAWDKILYYPETDSTNNRINELAMEGAEEGIMVIAGKQTAGRGRAGRLWDSIGNEGLYMSLLLRPVIPIEKVSMVTLIMGYSICKVIHEILPEVKIKWPNDLVCKGKKLCGILCELHCDPTTAEADQPVSYHITAGVGVNVNNRNWSDRICETATSLLQETEKEYDIPELAKRIRNQFQNDYVKCMKAGNLLPIKEEYEEHMANRNLPIRIIGPREEYVAILRGIRDNGMLMVESDGVIREIDSGEISIRGIKGYVD